MRRSTCRRLWQTWSARSCFALLRASRRLSYSPNTVSQVFVLSDDAPEGLLTSLDARFPSAVKVCLSESEHLSSHLAARHYWRIDTLRYRSAFHANARGRSLRRRRCRLRCLPRLAFTFTARSAKDDLPWLDSSQWRSQCHRVRFLVLQKSKLNARSAQGNIILTLDNKPATRLLVDLINAVGDTQERKRIGDDKEVEYYLGRVDHAVRSLSCSSPGLTLGRPPHRSIRPAPPSLASSLVRHRRASWPSTPRTRTHPVKPSSSSIVLALRLSHRVKICYDRRRSRAYSCIAWPLARKACQHRERILSSRLLAASPTSGRPRATMGILQAASCVLRVLVMSSGAFHRSG